LLSSKMLLLYLLRLNQQPGLMRYVIEEPRGRINESLKKRIKLVQEYIHHNYHKNISLDELSNIACISKNYFVSIFKESLGKTPMDYLAVIRLEKAKEFLLHTQKPVKRIASDTGFSSVSSFSQFFTRMIGCSPKEYRESSDIITIVDQEKEENHEKV
jgi:transcriptional regulator GlxA family with amidase domain